MTAAAVGYLQILRQNPDFRRLWLAEVVSYLGDWFNTIALFTAVAALSGRTEAMSAVFVAKMLPVFFMTPVAGPLIDRFDRKKLLVATDLARAVAALGLVVAYRLGSIELLVAILFVMVAFSGIFIPAKNSVLPQITSEGELGTANALSAGTWSVMLAFGAALGGLVTGVVGVEAALVIDAATFVLSALLLAPLPALVAERHEHADRSFRAGLRYLRDHPRVASSLCIKPLMALAGGGVAMLPVFGTRVFPGHSGPTWMGLLYAARGLGALVGSLVVRRILGDASPLMRRAIAPGFLVVALAYLGLGQAQSIWQAAAGFFATTVGSGMLWTYSSTLAGRESDNEVRGRIFALEFGALTLTMAIAAGIAGALVDRAGWAVRSIASATGVVLLLPAILWLVLLPWLERSAPEAPVVEPE